jgi:arginase family enzyme
VTHVTRTEDLIARLPADRPLYVHFDVDILDADEAPATLYPVKGGPSVSAMCDVARRIRDTDRVAAVSMTVWALNRDEDRRTEKACLSVLDALTA